MPLEGDGIASTNKRMIRRADFKSKVALEAKCGLITITEGAHKIAVNPILVRQWKNAFVKTLGACLITGAVLSLPITIKWMRAMLKWEALDGARFA